MSEHVNKLTLWKAKFLAINFEKYSLEYINDQNLTTILPQLYLILQSLIKYAGPLEQFGL